MTNKFTPLAQVTTPPLNSCSDARSDQDTFIIARLKEIWAAHHENPSVRSALRQALEDGQVTAEELLAIQASAAYAVAEKTKDFEAFNNVEDDPKLMQEAMNLQSILDPSSLAAMAISEILHDGKVTKQEMAAFNKAYGNPERVAKSRPAIFATTAAATAIKVKSKFPTPQPHWGSTSRNRDKDENQD